MVLAGGPGRRFGRPKAGALLGGTTLVERAVAILAARCDRVVVVSRPGIELPGLPAAVTLVHDRPGPDAPLVALATGLAALEADDVLVLGCDLPLAGPLLDRLLEAPPGTPVVGVDPAGRAQPLCARYPRARALAAADRLLGAGALAAHGLLDALDAVRIEAHADELLNVNTPADLERAEAALGR